MNVSLSAGQARPHALVAGAGTRLAVVSLAGPEQAVEHLLRSPHDRRLVVNGGDGRHPLLVGLLPFGAAHHAQGALRLDHRNALAVDRRHQDLTTRGFDLGGGALSVERLEVDRGLAHELLGRALGHAHPGQLGQQPDRLVKRRADHGPHQPPLILVTVGSLG